MQRIFFMGGVRNLSRFLCRHQFAGEVKKKIPESWEISLQARVEMGNALLGAHTCRMFANLMKDNLQYINDYHIATAMQSVRMYEMDLDLDSHFYSSMVPVIMDYVGRFTRDHNRSLGQIIAYSGYLGAQDDKLWSLYEQKLIKERLYRYVPLENIVEMVHGISHSQYGSPELFATLERVLITHRSLDSLYDRLALSEEQRQLCAEAFQKKEQGSPLLYKLLADPHTDYEAELRSQQKKLEA